MSRRVKLAMVVLFLAAGGCTAVAADDTKPTDPNPPTTIKIDVARGDRWTYEVRDGLTDELRHVFEYAVTDVSDSEIDARLRILNPVTNAETVSLVVFDRNWRRKETAAERFRPADEETGVPSDIQVGKTWQYNFEMSRNNLPSRVKFDGKAKVESWERIDLGNGLAFDAFKITYDASITPVVNNRKWQQRFEQWYAPAVQRYVRLSFESRLNGKLVESTAETLRDYQRREQ